MNAKCMARQGNARRQGEGGDGEDGNKDLNLSGRQHQRKTHSLRRLRDLFRLIQYLMCLGI